MEYNNSEPVMKFEEQLRESLESSQSFSAKHEIGGGLWKRSNPYFAHNRRPVLNSVFPREEEKRV